MPANKRESINDEELKHSNPQEYEQKYVHNTYSKIAHHFSNTRHTPWPKVVEFLKMQSPDKVLVDVGCGNGKNLGIAPGPNFGCDICPEFLQIAKEKGHTVVQADILKLPYKNNFADIVISIAVVHHLVTDERRFLAIVEMLRILKSGGRLLMYVWANMEECNGDCFVGWDKNKCEENNDLKRFYHFFNEGELEKLCLKTGMCEIERSYFDKENWAVIVKKK